MANHAPHSFWITLDQNDPDQKVISSLQTWFNPEEADVWVYFLNSEGPNRTVPPIVRKALETIQGKENDFLGCVAALDLAAMAYGQISADHASIQEKCTKY